MNYNYLFTPSSSIIDEPPLSTSTYELPIEKLKWEDLERLCLRMAEMDHSIHDCEIFGVSGEKQDGIDIFAKNDKGKYSAYQCKRYKTVTKSNLEDSVKLFKKGSWASKCDHFFFCTSYSLNKTVLQKAFNSLELKLKKLGIQFVKWDKIQICRILKNHPQIVYDFFGKEWVRKFNGEDKLKQVIQIRKLDANQVIEYRKELLKLYTIVFNNYDAGILNREIGNKPFPLQERFVMLDAIEEKESEYNQITESKDLKISKELQEIYNQALPESLISDRVLKESQSQNWINIEKSRGQRVALDIVLTKNRNSVILGDPGSGKSTFLRNLVLDILSDTPKFVNVAQAWGGYLPIWLPFAFITKNIAVDFNISIDSILKAWLKSQASDHLYMVIREALNDERLILIIDGIDELTDSSTAKQAISRIQIHSELKKTILIFSSRPFGYRLLKDSFSQTKEIHLLPFNTNQQYQYAFYWYQKWYQSLGHGDYKLAARETNNFIDALSRSLELKHLAENPLLLSILVTQKLRDSVLPTNRTEALEEITKYLINIHPKKRVTAANIIVDEKFDFDLVEVFRDLAFYIHSHFNSGVIEKTDAKKRIVEYLTDMMGISQLKAKQSSEEIIAIGANDYGIIIEKSENQIAFTHRLFQEFLSAKHLIESEDQYKVVLSDWGGHPSWHQVIKFYFGLIPNSKPKLFKESIELIGKNLKPIEFQQLSQLLKFDVALTLNNSPVDLSQKYFREIVEFFEYESHYKLKRIYWKIILDSVFNRKLKEEVFSYLAKYFPNNYKYNDSRINSIRDIKYEMLSKTQKEFLIKSLINGNNHQKLDASNSIRRFIKDEWLQSKVIEIIKTSTNPYIVPYALNSLIANEVEQDIKIKLIGYVTSSEDPSAVLFNIKLKIHLNRQDDSDLIQLISLQKEFSSHLKEEVISIFIQGWPESNLLLNECLTSVKRKFRFEQTLDSEVSWKILFHCYHREEAVIVSIINELRNEQYPFSGFIKHDVWRDLSSTFKDNAKLISEVDLWIEKQDRFHEPEIAFASLLGRTDKAKKYLIDHFPNASFPHWFTSALVEGWRDDKEVNLFLKSYFKSCSNERRVVSAGFFDVIFSDNEDEGVSILEELIFDRKIHFRDRAVHGLIKLDREHFRSKLLKKLVMEELPLIEMNDFWGTRISIYHILLQNFRDEPIVRLEIFPKVINNTEYANLIINIYPDDINVIDTILQSSLPLHLDLRLDLAERLGEAAGIDSNALSLLSKYGRESEEIVMSESAVRYFNYLSISDPQKVISICSPNIFYRGFDADIQRQIAFLGYVIAKRLDEYFDAKEEGTNAPSNPGILFESSVREMSSTSIKILVDNFDYLNKSINCDQNRIARFESSEPQRYWGFWARFSDKSSPTYSNLMDYINENSDTLDNLSLIEFLNNTSPQSIILKSIALRLVKTNGISAMSSARILGFNFNKDEKVYSELIIPTSQIFNQQPKIVALCIGWPETPILKSMFDELVEKHIPIVDILAFHLKFLFRDIDNIIQFFNQIFENSNQAKRHYSDFIYPLLRRIKNDLALQNELKRLLLNSNSTSEKISYFSILNLFNSIDSDILLWKSEQIEQRKSYGYNILTNKFESLSDVLSPIIY